MVSSVRASLLGHHYQHRHFWIEACRLFNERALVSRVAIERIEVRAFDDVTTTYAKPRFDAFNRQIDGDCYQLKFHVDYDREIHGRDLIIPKFIGAPTYSLFDRLAEATRDGALPKRLTLVTPWRIANDDPLRKLVSPRTGEIVLGHLFAESATKEMHELRESWRTALGSPTDAGMMSMLQHLVIRDGIPQWQLDGELENSLVRAGLAPIDPGKLGHPYISLSEAFLAGETYEHDANGLEAYLKAEGLWVGRREQTDHDSIPLGIKSFSPFAFHLEDEANVLNLLPFFHGRATAEEVQWDRDVFDPIKQFLEAQVQAGKRYELYFDTHLSIAFAAGWILDKASSVITPIQRFPSGQRLRWPNEGASETGPLWEDARVVDLGAGPETAVAIEVTQPVTDDVAIYLKNSAPAVGKLVVFTVAGGPSRTSVRDGHHAHALAESLCELVRDLRPAAERARPLHLFVAAPAALAFLIGRQAAPWGPTISYEYDFDTKAPGAYSPSFRLPPLRKDDR